MKKILVVDDSALMRRVVFDIINADKDLRAERYAVNGLDALEILKSDEKFDAIVLDINMPKMNGIQLLPRRRFRHWSLVHLILSQNRIALRKQRGHLSANI